MSDAPHDETLYADAAWTVEDILRRWRCTPEEAQQFLRSYQNKLRDYMIESGWEWLDLMVPFKARPEEEWARDDPYSEPDEDRGESDEEEPDDPEEEE